MFACSTLKMEMCCYNDTLRFMSMMWLTWVMFHSAVIVGVMSDLTSRNLGENEIHDYAVTNFFLIV